MVACCKFELHSVDDLGTVTLLVGSQGNEDEDEDYCLPG